MFELSVAFKYLTPRWRQLSVSIISLISILVIALVVWLIVVFFSVTHGLEKSWIHKLIALTAPVRAIPTEAYYKSYYYQADGISSASDYLLKSIGEKLKSAQTDPYDPAEDSEPPANWPLPDKNTDGSVKDLVKLAYQSIMGLPGIPGLAVHDYENTVSNLRLRLVRTQSADQQNQSFLSQTAYLGSLDPSNPTLMQAIQKITMEDLNNVFRMLAVASDNIQEDAPEDLMQLHQSDAQEKLRRFFASIHVRDLQTPLGGWMLPRHLLPSEAHWNVAVVMRGAQVSSVIIPKESQNARSLVERLKRAGIDAKAGQLNIAHHTLTLTLENENQPQSLKLTPLQLEGEQILSAELIPESLDRAHYPSDVRFNISFELQGTKLSGAVTLGSLSIASADFSNQFEQQPAHPPVWLYQVGSQLVLPTEKDAGEGILLPRSFKEAGTLVGDRGYLSYYAPTTSSVQEQRLPVYVAGFYDPGIIPIGGKFVLTSSELTNLIRSAQSYSDPLLANGINIRFDDITQAETVKKAIVEAFKQAGIEAYWRVETYNQYEFTKDLIQQLHSERNLWTLIATVIIIVACSNIISMLIILVNDKKLEIGILRSMGASSLSIAAIFGICGMIMGMVGSIIGTLAAVVTLRNLQALIDFIGRIQGFEMFNPVFYGEILPNQISIDALTFVIVATSIVSLVAGIVPAMKASMLRPSSILRSE